MDKNEDGRPIWKDKWIDVHGEDKFSEDRTLWSCATKQDFKYLNPWILFSECATFEIMKLMCKVYVRIMYDSNQVRFKSQDSDSSPCTEILVSTLLSVKTNLNTPKKCSKD